MVDIITVGSGTVDVFVRTSTQEIREHETHKDVCYHIGDKVLIKDLHYATGGGGTNAAVSLARMGHHTAWLGVLGKDANTHYLREVLQKEHVEFIGKVLDGKSGYSVILVGLERDRTILAYKGINDQLELSDSAIRKLRPKWFYFSAMLGTSMHTQKKIAQHAKKHHIPYAYNPSCYLAQQGVRGLSDLVKGAEVLVMNAQEAAYLLRSQEHHLVENATALGGLAKIGIVTDGPRPAYAHCDGVTYKLTPRATKVADTTGAGDAFGSGVVSALLKNKPLKDALRIGYVNARSVLKSVGAKSELLKWRSAVAQSKTIKVTEV